LLYNDSMNYRFIISGLALGAVLSLAGCNSSLLSKPMAFDNVEYVQEFPKTFNLSGGETLDLDILGTMGISVQDSLLIVSNNDGEGFWSFYSLPDYSPLGKFIKMGREGSELLSAPLVDTQFFYKEDGNLNVLIYDFMTGRVLCMDITKTLDDGVINMTDINAGLPKSLFTMMPLDTNIFFCREVNRSMTSLDRFISSEGERTVTPNMAVLNDATLTSGSTSNITLLNSTVVYDSSTDLVVEVTLNQNIINVYNLNKGPVSKTFCYGGKLNNVTESNFSSRKYSKVVGYEHYFAALYQGYRMERYANKGKTPHPRIQFFGWNPCEPLAEIVLDRDASSFDIDFRSGKLYTASYYTEEICVYDIKDVLEYLPS